MKSMTSKLSDTKLMTAKRIVFLVADIHLGGGGERVAANMANHFAAKGDEVSIVSISTHGPGTIFAFDKRVQIEYLNVQLNNGNKLVRKIESVLAVRKYFRNINCQTCLLGIGTYPNLLAALITSNDHLIKIGCQHGSYASVKHAWYILRWLLYRKLNAVVSLTQWDVPELQKLNRNIRVIPNSVSFFPEQPAELNNKTILSIGRIDYPKGYDLLLEVFHRFCLGNGDWNLRIVGEGPLEEKIKRMIADKGLDERISITSATDSIIDEYLNASVYLMTSRTEGLPMVLLEAQACGLPILAFDCETGPREIINDGKDGYLIENYDVTEMSQKLLELCNDISKRKDFGRNARINVERFFPDQIFKKWEALFQEYQDRV